MIKIVKYQGNKEILVKFMEDLQDYLVQIDPLKRRRRLPEYGEIYTDNLLKKISENQGIIYIAKLNNIPVGMVAGIIEKYTKHDEIECIPTKQARVIELIVSEKYRGKKIGKLLMDKAEKYFQSQQCDVVFVDVFEPNVIAHDFYKKSGYQDRLITMIKKLS